MIPLVDEAVAKERGRLEGGMERGREGVVHRETFVIKSGPGGG